MTTKNTNWNYLFKHWFFTLLLGPVISQIIMYIIVLNPNKIVGLLEVYPITLIFSFAFSIPTYILYSILYHFLSHRNINEKYVKIILIAFAVSGVFITTTIIKGSMMKDIAWSYSISSIISGAIFKLNFKE